jgi:hypothetical protein
MSVVVVAYHLTKCVNVDIRQRKIKVASRTQSCAKPCDHSQASYLQPREPAKIIISVWSVVWQGVTQGNNPRLLLATSQSHKFREHLKRMASASISSHLAVQ